MTTLKNKSSPHYIYISIYLYYLQLLTSKASAKAVFHSLHLNPLFSTLANASKIRKLLNTPKT